MKIYVGFSSPKKWQPFAWLIMKAYRIPYDHVYAKVYIPEYDRTMVFQASKTIVNFMSWEVFTSVNNVYKEFEIEIQDSMFKPLVQKMMDLAGDPYSIKEVLGIAWVRVNYWLGRKVENPIKAGSSEWVCSEVADYLLTQFAPAYAAKEDYENVDPQTLFNALNDNESKS